MGLVGLELGFPLSHFLDMVSYLRTSRALRDLSIVFSKVVARIMSTECGMSGPIQEFALCSVIQLETPPIMRVHGQ